MPPGLMMKFCTGYQLGEGRVRTTREWTHHGRLARLEVPADHAVIEYPVNDTGLDYTLALFAETSARELHP